MWRVVPVGLLLNPPPGPPPHLVPPTSEQVRPLMTSGLFLTVFQTTFQTPLWPPTWPSERPLDTKMVSQASLWTPFGNRFRSKLAVASPCKNLIIYHVFITKTPFGTRRVPNKTFTCIHGAPETTFCAFFSPLWRPRGAPGLKTELPDGPEASQKAPQNPSKSHQNPLWSAILCFRASWGAPPNQK